MICFSVVVTVLLLMCTDGYAANGFIRNDQFKTSGNRIYFYNMEGGAGSSDMILVESNGNWGLIDAGHRYAGTITDENGTEWDATVSNLSCQAAGKNGRDAMNYMIDTLGVDHLDFIIGTHGHSDHIGGIPEIADLKVTDRWGREHDLVDASTVYFYKSYHHTGSQDDDLGEDSITYSWHTQAFYYQAVQAIAGHGGQKVDVSCGILTAEGESVSADQSENISKMDASGNFDAISYESGKETDPYDDRLAFRWEDMEFDLYHLFSVEGALNDNVNSLVTVITCNGHNVFTAGDMDTQLQVEQKLAAIVEEDHGHFDLVKMSHHGIFNGSNSQEFIDCLQPVIMISTNHWTNIKEPSPVGVYSSVKYYAAKQYGTKIYAAGLADRMLEADLSDDDIQIYNITGEGKDAVRESAETCLDSGLIQDGWSAWGKEIYTNAINDYFYFVNQEAVTGWNEINGKRYYFAEDGLMHRGWLTENGKTYYLNDAMQTGWKQIDGEWYCFDKNGALITSGWAKDSTGWMWMDETGRITKDAWINVDGFSYYLDPNGYMASATWIQNDSSWYYLKASGQMASGEWLKDKGHWYYFKPDGRMASGEWLKDKGYWYYLKTSGQMASGEWLKDKGYWYYLKTSGQMVSGEWLKDKGEWYYLKSSGQMAVNEWAKDTSGWRWMNNSGKIARDQWLSLGSDWYYINGSGYMVTGRQKIEGEPYEFDSAGRLKLVF